MKPPVQITYRNMTPSTAVTARIEAEAARLDTFFDRIISCRVLIEAPPAQQRQAKPGLDKARPRAGIKIGRPRHEDDMHHATAAFDQHRAIDRDY